MATPTAAEILVSVQQSLAAADAAFDENKAEECVGHLNTVYDTVASATDLDGGPLARFFLRLYAAE